MSKKIIALIFASVLLLLSACSQPQEDIPDLLEPANATRTSYIVKKMNISNVRHYDAVVVPDLKSVKSETDATILESYVYIGDYVEKGAPLLKYDMSLVLEQMNSISSQITNANVSAKYQYEILEKEIEIAKLELKKIEAQEGASKMNILAAKQKVEELELSLKQKKETNNLQVSNLQQQYYELSVKASNDTVVAPCSGNVVYSQNLVYEDRVSKGSTLFYIADESELKIRGSYIASSYAKFITSMEAYIGSKVYNITLNELSAEEVASKVVAGETMYSYFTIENPENIKSGDYAGVVIHMQGGDDCLAVPLEAIFKDESGTLVYILDKDNNLIRQSITTGRETDLYVEVVSGLKEGDRVYVKD